MKSLNPAYVAAVANAVNSSPYVTLLSMELASLAPGTAESAAEVEEKVSRGRRQATGRQDKVGKTVAPGEASIRGEAGDLVAHGTSTLLVQIHRRPAGEGKLPPKFIGKNGAPEKV